MTKESVFTWYDCIQPKKEETNFLATAFELNIKELKASIYTLRRPNNYHDNQNAVENFLIHGLEGKDFEADKLGITKEGSNVITDNEGKLQTGNTCFDGVKKKKEK
ncbi:CorA family divalent cation transporter, partial [Staphylococcus simulans]